MTLLKDRSAKGKNIYPNLQMTPKNKMSAKKKYFTIIFIRILHKACQILSAFTNWYYSVHLQSVPFVFLFIAIPRHIIISPIHCVGYTALLKPFTVTFGEMHCHAVMIHTD
jgi:hypothetical protein